ncbi:hypothetical protein V491_00155 [Pseudogymnoascus sp. VKM F-3775]|nr:hypothetical protein V491_00155 [Pseudogymnoascus sp. VKM F-3775]
MSGVPFTQIIGFIFLFAYLIGVYEANAIHRATLRQKEQPWLPFAVKAQRIPETVRYRLAMTIEVLRFFAYGVHLGLWLSVAHMMVYTSKDAEKSNLERFLVSAVMLYYQYPILLVALPAGLYAKRYLGNWLHERFSGSVGTHRMRPVLHAGLLYGPSVLCSFSAFALVIFLFQLLKNHFSYKQERRLGWKAYTDTKESFVKLSGFLLMAFVLLICIPLLTIMIFMANAVFERVIESEPEVNKPELEKEAKGDDDDDYDTARSMAALGFGLSNLFFGVLFYANVYDAEGTSKPGWSEMLG